MITLLLGGEKSGKSDHALELLADLPGPQLFVATGKALDAPFRVQIAAHRVARPVDMPVLEVGAELAGPLERARAGHVAIVVDSLDYWLYACLATAPQERNRFLELLDSWDKCALILVSAEVGLGPVAATSETRAFVRALGELNRAVARHAEQVRLVAAGLPLTLK